MTSRFNVLISSAGRRYALLQNHRHALEALGLRGEVLAADASRLSAAALAADRSFVVPRCKAPDFIPAMLELCRSQAVSLLVPTIDTELPMLAEHRDDFAAVGTTVAVSAPDVVAIGGDKDRTHAWLVGAGFPTVRQAHAREAIEDRSTWPFPFLVKPKGGSSSIGVAIVRDEEALRAACRGGDYIAQSIAPGIEYTVDILAGRSGECRCTVPRRRLEVRAGEVSKAVTVRHPLVEDLARKICQALPGAYGALNLQVFHDERTQELSVIELNPRFGGGFPLAQEAGARYPQWIIEEILGLPSTASPAGWRSGLVMVRYDAAVFADAAALGLGEG